VQQPKLEVRKVEDSIYGYGLFREDRIKAIVKGISKSHANHLKKILSRKTDLPESIIPIRDWFNFEDLVDVDRNGFGKH